MVVVLAFLAVVWSLAMADVSSASWLLALLPGGCLWWPATLGADSGDVSMNKLTGYGGPRFWVDLEAFLLSPGRHGDRADGEENLVQLLRSEDLREDGVHAACPPEIAIYGQRGHSTLG